MAEIPLGQQSVSIDDMLKHAGEFGRFQAVVQLFFCIMQFPPTFPTLIMYFAALDPKWRCSTMVNNTHCNSTRVFPNVDMSRCDMPRNAWEYTRPKEYSVVTQYDLSCSKHWYIYLTTSICFAGMAFGSIAMGYLGDRYGRKKVLFPSVFFLCLFSLLSSFSPNIELFLVCRFLVGFLRSGTSVFMTLIAAELTGSKYRPMAGTSLRMILPIANCMLGLQAYYATTWSTLSILCSAPYFITILSYFIVPESIRWLRLKGRHEEVMEVFKRMSKWNRTVIPDNIVLAPLPQTPETTNTGISQLFKTLRGTLKTLNLGFAWMMISSVYYGVSLAADDLGGSLYFNFMLISLVEFPAGMAAVCLLNTIGRKRTIVSTLLIGSLGCIGLSYIPKTFRFYKSSSIACGVFCKFLITISYNSIYTWTVEILPTTARSAGMGFTQFTSRVGAVGAPFIAKGLKLINLKAPFVFMGAIGCVTTMLLVFLPETKGKPTKETITRRPTEGHDEEQTV